MNNNSLINNIYINILYVENSFLFFLKAMVSRNFLKNLVAKNLIEFHSLHPPSPTKYTMCLVLIKTNASCCKTVVLGVLVMAVGEHGRDEGGCRRH